MAASQGGTSELPDWPPASKPEDLARLTSLARDYALSHSIIYRPLLSSSAFDSSATGGDFNTSVIHAPFALYPSPLPKRLFEQAQNVQEAYNALYACIACDFEFLEKVVGGNVAKVDEFQGQLWKIAKAVREEGIVQTMTLGLFRSDYLMHQPAEGPSAPLQIKQVEFNTISSSFGALSSRVSLMHRELAEISGTHPKSESFRRIPEPFPRNGADHHLAGGLANAWSKYDGVNYGKKRPSILFVVQDHERNAFDQRGLEWQLICDEGVPVIRQTFSQLATSASLAEDQSRTLLVRDQSGEQQPITLVYFRAGYGPGDYPTSQEWETRHLLERSGAIKCPSVQLQLAGAKKVQQVLTEPGVLKDLIRKHKPLQSFTYGDMLALEDTFTGLYPMDDSPLGKEALRMAYAHPERFVLKPQREGGGNNVYRGDIPPYLDELERKDQQGTLQGLKHREGYILMDLIQPPEGTKNWLVRAGDPEPRLADVVSELGIYGVALFSDKAGKCTIHQNNKAGHLLRTKGRESDEGGVAVGFSVIDSPLLV